jgi:hypothetical protein
MADLILTAAKKAVLLDVMGNGCIKTYTTLKAKRSAKTKIEAAGDTDTVSLTGAEVSALYEFLKFTKYGGTSMTEQEEIDIDATITSIEALLS